MNLKNKKINQKENKNHYSSSTHQRGFTLIEVVISIFLFSILSIALMDSLSQTTKYQKQIERIIKKSRISKNISQVITKDVQMSVSIVNVHLWFHSIYQAFLSSYNQDNYFNYILSPENKNFFESIETKDLPPMGMNGEKNKLTITSLSQSSEDHLSIVKIQYLTDDCPSRIEKDKTSKCLKRSYSKVIGALNTLDHDTTQTSVLLYDIKDISFSYCKKSQICDEVFTPENIQTIYGPLPFPYVVKADIQFEDTEKINIHLSIPLYLPILSNQIFKSTALKLDPPYQGQKTKNKN